MFDSIKKSFAENKKPFIFILLFIFIDIVTLYFSFTFSYYLFLLSLPFLALIIYVIKLEIIPGLIIDHIRFGEKKEEEMFQKLSHNDAEEYIKNNPNSKISLAEQRRRESVEEEKNITKKISNVQEYKLIKTMDVKVVVHKTFFNISASGLPYIGNAKNINDVTQEIKEEKYNNQKISCFEWINNDGTLLTLEEIKEQFRLREKRAHDKISVRFNIDPKSFEMRWFKIYNNFCFYERLSSKGMIRLSDLFTGALDNNIYEDGLLISHNKETLKSSESVDLSGDQKMLHVVYPKLKGIDFSTVKFGASGNSAKEFFASDIDGNWHYAQSQMIMLFKAFSKDKIESELKLLLNQNEINLDDKIEKTELLAEHWKGDGFKIEHPVMEGIDIIIITNEDMIPEDSLTLQKTDLAPEIKLPTGYENIGIEHVYDGSKFLKANQGQFSLNIPLLFKDNDESTHYIIIGVSTLTVAKRIIDEIIEKNYGKQYFKELDEKDGWQYIYANKFFTIGFLSKYHCVRLNMLHNLADIRQ